MPTLVLLRHGESAWNSQNRFTGWVDVDLTPRGEEQARRSGRLLRQAGLVPDVAHASVLVRAVRTASLVLEAVGRPDVPSHRHWRLNERCYGALQGQERRSVRARYGEEQYQLWRRSYDVAPPPLERAGEDDLPAWARESQADGVPLPRTESLADVVARLLPYWREAIAADLRAGRTVLVVAHSNSLRALVAHLDALSPEEVLGLNIPTAMPLRYELDRELKPLVRGGEYLEPAAAAEAAAAVAHQGR